MQGLTPAYLEAVAHKCLIGAAALAAQDLHASVALVGKQRMADVAHVGADLMGAPCLQDTFHQGDVAEALEHLVVGDGGLAQLGAWRQHRHAQPVLRVAADVALYASLVLGDVAPYQCYVAAVGGLVEELQSEACLCVCCLCHDEQSAGVLVNAVYQSHLRVVGVEGTDVAHVPCYRVDQCSVEVADARVYHQAGRLVDYQYVVILVCYRERYLLGQYVGVVVRTVEHQRHHVARSHLVVALHRSVVDMHESCICGLLYAVATGVLQVDEEELVHTHRLLSLVSLQAEVLVELYVFLFYHHSAAGSVGAVAGASFSLCSS